MGQPRKTLVETANATVRAEEALTLYIGGCTFRQIAAKMDVSLGTAHTYVKKSLQEAAKVRLDLAGAELEAQSARLMDAIQRVASSDGYQAGEAASVSAYIKVCESMRKLWGLDQPTKVDNRHSGAIDVQHSHTMDLAKLSVEELEAMRALTAKAQGVTLLPEQPERPPKQVESSTSPGIKTGKPSKTSKET